MQTADGVLWMLEQTGSYTYWDEVSLPVAEDNQRHGRTPWGSPPGAQPASWAPAAPVEGCTPGCWEEPQPDWGGRDGAARCRPAGALQSWAAAARPHRSSSSTSGEHSHSATGYLHRGGEVRLEVYMVKQRPSLLALVIGQQTDVLWWVNRVYSDLYSTESLWVVLGYTSTRPF